MNCSSPRSSRQRSSGLVGRSPSALRAVMWALRGVACALRVPACALLFAALPAAQSLKVATLVPEGSVWDKALRRMGAEWKESTGGRVSLVLYPNGVAGDEAEILKKIRIGQLQGAFVSAAGLGSIEPSFNLFGIPMFLRSDEELRAVLEETGPSFEKRLKEHGLVIVNWGVAGWLRVFSTEPVKSFEDFKRLKFFVWGQGNQLAGWFEDRGFKSVILPATEVATGLQTGLVQSMPATPLAALSFQWFRSAPYMFDHRFAPLVGATVLSAKAWERLSEEDRAAVLEAGRRAGESLFRDVPGQEASALEEMRSRGLTLTRSSGEDMKKWEELAAYLERRFREDSVPEEAFAEVAGVLRRLRGAGAPGGGR